MDEEGVLESKENGGQGRISPFIYGQDG